jgi:hypothetical protein
MFHVRKCHYFDVCCLSSRCALAWTFAVVATWIFRAVLGAAAGYRLVHLTLLQLQLLHLERAKGVEGFEALGHGHRLFY